MNSYEMMEDLKEQLKNKLIDQSVCVGEFVLASGVTSDFYVDSKLTTLDPISLKMVGEIGWHLVRNFFPGKPFSIDSIGGLTMGADPIAIAIALESINDGTGIQAFSVRKSPKTHGRNKLIEGNFSPGDRVIVVDDVITTGGSTLQAIKGIREAGGVVVGCLVLVDREESGRETIQNQGIPVVSIFRKSDLMALALAKNGTNSLLAS